MMNYRSLLSILIVFAAALTSCAGTPIEKYEDHYYDLFASGSTSWIALSNTCVRRGGYLVTLETSDEMEFVHDYIDRYKYSLKDEGFIRIGLRDTNCTPSSSACTNFRWQNVTDGALTTNGWDDGYPISGDNPCAYIDVKTNKWRNGACSFGSDNNYFMCEYLDPCRFDPCLNNGACVATWSGYDCNCATGFDGDNCEIDIIDDCASIQCLNGGVCKDGINSYSCDCNNTGFTGEHCETEKYECASNPCINGACIDRFNSYSCDCTDGYTGDNCEIDIDECASSPCQLGLCENRLNSYSCNCAPGITGKHCETNIDECTSDPCMHNGTCSDQIDSYQCTCTLWYTGVHCESINEDCSQFAPENVCQAWISKSSSSSDNNSDRPFLIPFVVTLIVLILLLIILAGWNIRNYLKAKRQDRDQAKEVYTKPKSEDIDLTPSAYSGIEAITMETEPDTDVYSEVGYANEVTADYLEFQCCK